MIRKLLATTALSTLIATGAFAQATTPAPDPADPMAQEAPVVRADGHLATQIIGENVYSSAGDDAQHIGDVNDIVIGADGNIEAVVVGVGGFLGIGQKEVAVDFETLDWAHRDGDRWLVAPTTKEQLEQQATFDRSAYEPEVPVAAGDPALAPGVAPAPDATAEAPVAPAPDVTAEVPAEPVPETTAEAPADAAPADQAPEATAEAPADPATDQMAQDQAPAADGMTDTTTTAAIDRSTLQDLPATEIRAEEMIGTTVYGADDSNVGRIGDIILTADGNIDAYIIDVGGFLGIGVKEVAVGSDNLAFMVDEAGNRYLYTNFTREQLDAAPAYDGTTYAERRDEQRLMVQ